MAPSARVRKSSQRIQSRKSATTNNGLSVPATVAKASANAKSSVAKRKTLSRPVANQSPSDDDEGDEMPPLADLRVPVNSSASSKPTPNAPSASRRIPALSQISASSQPSALAAAHVYPAPTHSRSSPYAPTKQNGGHYPNERGNPPAGVGADIWDKAFNNANSQIYKQTPADSRVPLCKKARVEGLMRDYTVEKMIREGTLSEGFIDANP